MRTSVTQQQRRTLGIVREGQDPSQRVWSETGTDIQCVCESNTRGEGSVAKGQELSEITHNGLGAALAQQNRDKPAGTKLAELKLNT